ncbi:transcriptional regulator ATRX homolog isoform X2 [Plodia interpunctella]|uniref:transcriptional regulator ATRX homolog isoform X2 n=1 Tax=Plodia interpunctella TaxID=58824 RepID=UPI002368AED9|nr:transcriptional regulator ATRX homolog isoform X2 [Plodia interpunctella]
MAAASNNPVYEVLNDAVEYLCKLGSNLRIRSETMKNKNIRKERLRNSHAIQKAAKKVLLICELSKKSLQNVEVGVKNVLTSIEQAQSCGGKKLSQENVISPRVHDKKYEYFEYESIKLRIAKNIPLKHFMSVKVVARSMPSALLKKYPVLYDCKLYRLRMKKNKLQKQTDLNYKDMTKSEKKEESDFEGEVKSKELNNFEGDGVVADTKEGKDEKSEPSKVYKAKRSKKKVDSSDDHKKEESNNPKVYKAKRSKKKVDSLVLNEESERKTENVPLDNDSKSKLSDNLSPKSDAKVKKNEKSDSDSDDNNKHEKSEQHTSSGSHGKLKRKRVAKLEDDSDRESIKLNFKQKKSNNDIQILDNIVLSDDDVKTDKDVKHNSKKMRVIDDDSSDESQKSKTESSTKNKKNETLDGNVTEKSDSEENNKINESHSDSKENTSEVKSAASDAIPLIKCVSISKLLKPSVLEKVVEKTINKEQEQNKMVSPKTNQIEQQRRDDKKSQNERLDNKYWMEKRKEVKAFRPKMFNINVNRLPKLTELFLEKHNLNRVTQFGSVVCEKKNKPIESDCSINKVKNALLNDSDSHDGAQEKSDDTDRVKSSLLQESDSENENTPKKEDDKPNENSYNHLAENLDEISKKTKNALLSSSESDNTVGDVTMKDINEKSPTNTRSGSLINNADTNEGEKENHDNDKSKDQLKSNNTDEVKSALLNSSDDSPKTPADKRRRDSQGTTPRSKRKHIMESMHAKKMLLTYSSSSETEDEQLRSVLKEIKDSLLEGISPDKEKKKCRSKHHCRKLATSSSDDEEVDINRQKDTSPLSDSNERTLEKNELLPKSQSIDQKSSEQDNDNSKNKQKETSPLTDSNEGKNESIPKSPSTENKIFGEDNDDKNKHNETDSNENGLKNESSSVRRSSSTEKKSSEKDKSGSESGTQDCTDDASDKQSNSSRSKIGRSRTNSTRSGSSQKSDFLDTDKDINGLTNLKTLNKARRRRSTSSETKSSRAPRRKKKMSKSLISSEVMLKAESSSDAASGAESEGGEDLSTVTMAPLNGGIDDLSKADLLVESDSSSSKNESGGEATKEESDENLKSKRNRKANAISSDSEAGSSRKKNAKVKISDFEDSEAESSEPVKKSKRKKVVDSDASVGSSDGGKKKRRRIKQVDSDGSGSDTENEGRNKHGRKNIRKVMGKNQLEEATKKAARQEKERIARIAERQKMYNNLEFDESGKPDEVVLEKVVLDFDPETKEPLIEVDRGLVKKLKPHQANGIKFMWNACFESVKRIKKDKGSGCILAHCMGLGKTLQVVSLTHTLLTHGSLTGVNRVLVVCPLSTVLNWVNEFNMWLKHAETEYEVDVYELSRFKQNSERAFQLQQWFKHGGVCVLGYEMFRNLSADNAKKFKKKMLRNFQESLVDPGPDLVVCDEGHLLKNEKTSLSQSMNRVQTLRRIVLTGTPLQNNLKEYYCMVQFVKPNLLGKYNEYLNRFVNPITNGQYTDSTEHDIRVMKRRSHVLHKMLDGAVQRRDYGVLAPFLPPKHEYVLFITLTELQIKLYQHYLDNYSRRPQPGKSSGFLFPDFQSLQRIWTHPLVLKYNSERYEIMQQKKRDKEEEDSEGSLADFIDDDSTPDESSSEESTASSESGSEDSRSRSHKKGKKKKSAGKGSRRGTRANPVELEEEEKPAEVVEQKYSNPTEWWIDMVTEDELEDMRNSSKLILLFDILRQCEAIGDKLLVFSQSLYSLDLIEHFLGKVDEATQEGRVDEKLGGHVGSWSPGVDYFRLDGSTSCENRSIWCKNFNREDNPRARLFLISTRAGGLGINLVAANRVVIFDVSWNPSHDVQSIFRVYRFGQKKPCYIYRFLAMGTMEEKIYERQVTKQAISKRVIDEQQIDRHYAENDLAELYTFEPRAPAPRPTPPLPRDRLFAEMLREHEPQIYKYHEHDSLLENKEEETLSEEERKAAWEDFENEKNRPPPAPAPMAWPGMMSGILQQQQLAYAALAAMLRKDMPNMSDQQIRDMLPHIYNANPGLMQKMGEIYKYGQPGMMNPGMMNPLMAGAGSGSMSGSSALGYEPPWQRQQQQQQQMRLQQILQQQHSMGAKYYAGGLGSRDPVAMALQQQRAREIMVGERQRGRGRPPLQPRAPRPPPSADVVTLDSD